MIITQIYDHFFVPYTLQQHMIRVASVAAAILEWRCGDALDHNLVLTTCLLHDLWNIVKMDFTLHTTDQYGTEIDWWQKKEEIITTYGSNCHDATLAMCHELGISKASTDIIEHMWIKSFVESEWTWETKLVRYVDMRVNPRQITALDNRMIEAKERYAALWREWTKEPLWTTILKHAHEQEQSLQMQTTTLLTSISEENTQTMQASLWSYDIPVWI